MTQSNFQSNTCSYVVKEAEGADRANGTEEAEGAEMALRMKALFYFDCFGHKEFKIIAYNGLWELYAVTRIGWDGWDRWD